MQDWTPVGLQWTGDYRWEIRQPLEVLKARRVDGANNQPANLLAPQLVADYIHTIKATVILHGYS